MRTFAKKQLNKNIARQTKKKNKVRSPRKPSLPSFVSPFSVEMPSLQRKCACGSSCPSCNENLGIQTKLKISEPGDKYEQEADRIAEQVMRMPESSVQRQVQPGGQKTLRTKPLAAQITPLTLLQRQAESTEKKVEETLQTKTSLGQPSMVVSSSLGNRITALRGNGRPLTQSERTFFEPRFGTDFSQVRVHTNSQAAKTAQSLNARAFTLGHNIVFGADQYSPRTSQGKKLLAHELTHVIQQNKATPMVETGKPFLTVGDSHLQRDITEEQLPSTPVEQILSDESYFENGIQRIDFYSAELAILHYDDGSQIRLGLIPSQISAPFEAVDYRTPRHSHLPVTSTAPSLGLGSILFLPQGRHAEYPPGITAGDIPRLVEQVGRTIRFTHHANGRIVPTEVNALSAPRLSAALREAEAEFVRQFDAMSENSVEVLETLEWVIILASMAGGLLAAGTRASVGRAAATRGGVATAAGIVGRAQSRLVQLFSRLLGTRTSQAITVEGVSFGGVRVATQGTELLVKRVSILNVSRIPGQGRLIHRAFEQAAIQAARQVGARTARVALELVQNSRWAAYLESQGYTFQVIANEFGGFTRVLTKVFTL